MLALRVVTLKNNSWWNLDVCSHKHTSVQATLAAATVMAVTVLTTILFQHRDRLTSSTSGSLGSILIMKMEHFNPLNEFVLFL